MTAPGSDSRPPVASAAGVREIAALARLELADAEVEDLVGHFQKMLDFVATLAAADNSPEPPATPAVAPSPITPGDDPVADSEGAVAPPLTVADWRPNAPESDDDGYFRVPRVIG